MKPVDQTRMAGDRDENGRFLSPPGNCWAACIASILELPIDQVPDEAVYWQPGMTDRQSYMPFMREMHRFCAARGFMLFEVPRKTLVYYTGPAEIFAATHCIMSGVSPRNPKIHHAVVARGYEIVHDPHPSRAGLAGNSEDWMHEFFIRQ